MHGLFWLSSMGLLAATVWMLASDANRPWKAFQREYRDKYALKTTGGVRQILLPELTQDFNFRRVARCDRCTTCHLGIEQIDHPLPLGKSEKALTPALSQGEREKEAPQPFTAHPRLDLYVGANSPHPAEEFGCTICHEGQGSATDFRWASHAPNDLAAAESWRAKYAWSRNPDWDFPMLPARLAESRCLQCHPNVTDLEPTARFPDPPAAKLEAGYQLVRRLGCYGCHDLEEGPSGVSRGKWLGGAARKTGPSLRQAAEKTSPDYLADRMADPAHFLPESAMPRLFGLTEHLEGPALAEAKRFEAVEIRAIAAYLMQTSEAVVSSGDSSSAGTATESPSAERGKKLFEMQGCLACHKHRDFPRGQAIQGPDLSRVGAKFTAANARRWLTGWLRDPARCSPQTPMPNPRLEKTLPADGGKTTDPAEDLAAYLLASRGDFQSAALPPFEEKDLDALAMLYARQNGDQSFSTEPAKKSDGLPSSTISARAQDAAAVGSGSNESKQSSENIEKKLQSLGRLAIAKRGCFGCHDIAGFEQSPGIGPSLGNWGRKPTSQLAFEKVEEFVRRDQAGRSASTVEQDYFAAALSEHRREGFLWQKLRDPRSFDYLVAAKKNFNEYLRMGRFNLTDAEREAVMTFVLGLTSDRPQGQYAYRPGAKRKAVIEGREVLDRFACAACHTLEMERWTIGYQPGGFPAPSLPENFAFLAPHFSGQELAASRTANQKGIAEAEIAGMPRLDSAGEVLEDEDDEGRPICYFTLWQPAAIDGRIWTVGGPDAAVALSQIVKKRPAWGGTLARLLYPAVLAEAKAKNLSAPEMEAWGWLPPALTMEGMKVQPAWLANYLRNPAAIRPASVLPMPKFNLSEEEIAALAAYFTASARNDANAIIDQSPKPQDPRPEANDRAMRFMLESKNTCTKCHLIGDYRPGGDGRNMAPNLADAGGRLQRQYIHRWLADPKSVLPYTPMPQNFPPRGEPQDENLLPGNGLEQLDAVEQLLVEYGEYAKGKMPIRKMMPAKNQ